MEDETRNTAETMRSPLFWQEVGMATVITQDNYVLLHVGRTLIISEVELACTVRLIFRLHIVMVRLTRGQP